MRRNELDGLTAVQLRRLSRELEQRLGRVRAALLVVTEGGCRQWRTPKTAWDRLLVARFGHRPSNRALNRLGAPCVRTLRAAERGARLRPLTLRRLALATGIPDEEILRALRRG